jgi:glycosyltransferase involved in cell wall biosynthesis
LHGRLDDPLTAVGLAHYPELPLIAISQSHRSTYPAANWVGVVHNGQDLHELPFGPVPGDYLLFIGRATREKGIDAAIRAAALAGERLVIAAKIRDAGETEAFETEVRPVLGRGSVEFVGEVSGDVRDRLFAGAKATLMLDDWPEPFGLVAIESMATGTPVIATPCGALPEIVTDGIDGAIVRNAAEAAGAVREVARLDRRRIRLRALGRFSASRMTAEYLKLYRRVIADAASAGTPELATTPR